ncbi:unnamed protein product [Cuscuta campestris]|uniref:CCD97-like C-terminal domain-containing protein n=1 Tax=Cuscuta campestris TaxID=132261 RepID=A0A484MAK1_9ASTE|nr:unnamed protein product [Cuscuta campestris]
MAETVSGGTMETISDRLSRLENLYFPLAVKSSTATSSCRKSLLLDLLSRDAPLFLERYGSLLTKEELREFEVLKDDYEINWHLKHLRSLISPTEAELKSRSAKVKNRRRAYMDKLVSGGQYFSEDAMREREPYLHHEYIGKFQDPVGRRMARPGERWSETLMRLSEEAVLVEKIKNEQQKRGVAQSDWIGFGRDAHEEEVKDEAEEEEEEEDDDDDDDDDDDEEEDDDDGDEEKGSGEEDEKDKKNTMADGLEIHSGGHDSSSNLPPATMKPTEVDILSAEDMQDRMDQFTNIMQHKFLLGVDNWDYSKIDEDESLDDHWLKEANYDAEEKYFDDI